MVFIWTAPDPLNDTAITKSIYITELQDAANIKKAEISQTAKVFIDQSTGKTYLLQAIEELKTTVNQLALDFGFTGGVTNAQLLGRPYVNHPTLFSEQGTGFEIINDLRRVLNLLVQQLDVIEVIQNWYDAVGSDNPLAHYNDLTNPPWDQIPDFIQTGSGTTCGAGYPTCDNTLAGDFLYDVRKVTDKSLIVFENNTGISNDFYREGPLGGPYFKIGNQNVVTKTTSDDIAVDDLYIYSRAIGGEEVWRVRRDLSEPLELLGDFGHSFGSISNIHVTEDDIIVTGHSLGSEELNYGRMNKTSGIVATDITLDFSTTPFDLLGTGGPYNVTRIRIGNTLERGGDVYFIYGEQYDDNGSPNTDHVVASAICKINSSGTMTLDSDLRSATRTIPDTEPAVSKRWGHTNSNGQNVGSIQALNSEGFYYEISSAGAFIFIPSDGPFPTVDDIATFNGTTIADEDYKGDDLFGNFMANVFFSENYLDGALATEAIPAVSFSTAFRFNAGPTDSVNVTWPRTNGVFRYILQRRSLPGGGFTDLQTVESATFGVGDIYSDTIAGLIIGTDYEIRVKMETGQGEILGAVTQV